MFCATRFVVDATENSKEGGVAVEVYNPQTVYDYCRMAEIYRKETQGSVLAWRVASLLLNRLLFLY